MSRMIKTPLGAVFPSVHAKVQAKQEAVKKAFNEKASPRYFELGNNVYSRNYGLEAKLLPGEVVDKQGSVRYGVLLKDQRYVRRHANQLFPRLNENRGAGVMDCTSQLPPVETEETGEKSLSVPSSREIMEETREIPEFTPPADNPRGIWICNQRQTLLFQWRQLTNPPCGELVEKSNALENS